MQEKVAVLVVKASGKGTVQKQPERLRKRAGTYNAEDLIQMAPIAMYDQNTHIGLDVPQAQSRVLQVQCLLIPSIFYSAGLAKPRNKSGLRGALSVTLSDAPRVL